MIRLVISAPGQVRLEEGALPEPAPGELRVRAESVGICGSDLHALAEGADAFRAAGEAAVKVHLHPQR